jgi:signal transduction histidine kinase
VAVVVATEPRSPAGHAAEATVLVAVVALGALTARRRRNVLNETDLKRLRELARVTSNVPDAHEKLCETARELLGADILVLFIASRGLLLSHTTAGRTPPPLRIPVDHPDSVVARCYREQRIIFVRGRQVPELPLLRELGVQALLAAPVRRGENRIGVELWAWTRRRGRLTARERTLVELITAEKGILVERAELMSETADLTRSQIRTRLARDLHDSVAQELATLRMYADTAAKALERQPRMLEEVIPLIGSHVDKAYGEMREILDALRIERPLVDLSLRELISTVVTEFRQRWPDIEVEVDVREDDDLQLRAEVRETVYFVVREALHNAAMHAKAEHVRIEVRAGRDGLEAIVEDDGTGFDPGQAHGGRFGVVGMRERAELAGGRLEVRSSPGRGTTVRLGIDRPTDDDDAPAERLDVWRAGENGD